MATLGEFSARPVQQCPRDAQGRRKGGRCGSELWDEEPSRLGRLPAIPRSRRFARVDKTLLVTHAGARHSVPGAYTQKALTLRVFWDRVEITDQERTVAVHARRSTTRRCWHASRRRWSTRP